MVRTLHAAGIEVILDVVYNHTAEGNHMGPTLSMRGIDNAAYYRLEDKDKRYYTDYTGTGNSLNAGNPHALQLIMDSLRYWVLEMHVDGFRFDLAAALAREFYDVDRLATFFELVQQDPVVSQVKLIAEPWDVGPGGYQVGNFPPQWTEWNGKYRDTVRDFWRGEPQALGEFASRLTGSADLYEHSGRRPVASVNFVTAHDGFTLRDLVSYDEKHNDANGEDGNDGADDNRSMNFGVEGPTDDPAVNTMRARQQRNFIATLLLSQGVPMLLHGDELGRTQQGNNNGYAQDNELTWVDWDNVDHPLIEFTAALARLRHDHPTFRRRRFFNGRPVRMQVRQGLPDIAWLRPDGTLMKPDDWESGFGRAVGVFLNGRGIRERDRRGEPIVDKHFIVLFNAGDDVIDFRIPAIQYSPKWDVLVDTAGEQADSEPLEPRHEGAAAREGAHRALGARRARAGDRPLRRCLACRADRLHDAGAVPEGGAGAIAVALQPRSTYRLQIRRDFDLDAAAAVTGYLRDLGVSWAYLSPLLRAADGSDHGYDVVDPSLVDPARGGRDGLDRFAAAARAAGLGILIDTVPNHMGISRPEQNPWWWDVLTQGQNSRYAEAFDIDWAFGGGKLRVPILGASLDEVIAAGDVVIEPDATIHAAHGVVRFYEEHVLPLAPDSIPFPVVGLGSAPLDDPHVIRQIIDGQHWEAIFWRREAAELNYRRFFTVTSLAGVRVEIPWVFDESHAEVLRWVREGLADGIRVDHPDGLMDPGGYLERLSAATDGAYVVVEKILEHGERLPAWWETHGTTGYDALAEIDRVLVDPAGEEPLDALDAQLRGGEAQDYADLIHETKRAIADTSQRAEVTRLVRALRQAHGPEMADDLAADALAEMLAGFPVYRSYLPAGREHLDAAATAASTRRPDLADAIARLVPVLADPTHAVARRFQQTTGPVMAKGVEDTAFYRYTRLGSLTEVGGDPSVFALAVDAFHHAQAERQAAWPSAMTTLSTHDTKRGEDVRARLNVPLGSAGTVGGGARRPARSRLHRARLVRQPAVPGGHRVVAGIEGATARIRREGLTRGGRSDRVVGSGRGVRDAHACGRRCGLRRRGRAPTDHGLRRRGRVGGVDQRAFRQAAAAHRSRRAGCLPGHRAVGAIARGSRQPSSGRLRRTAADAGRARCRIPAR